MNTGRIVNEKLFGKTELKSEKVELTKYDFKPFKRELDDSFASYRNERRSGMQKAYAAVNAHDKDIRDILNKAEGSINEFKLKAKELGIDYRSTKQFKEFQELKEILQRSLSSIQEEAKNISILL